MKTLTYILRVAGFELREVLRDAGVMLFVVLMPLGYPVIYALIYTNEAVREVPVAVWDECGSAESRALVRRMDAAREARVAFRVRSLEEGRERMAAGEAFCLVRVPEDYGRRLARGGQATVGLYADMGSMTYYKAASAALGGAAASAGARLVPRGGEGPRVEAVPLYNPQGGFAAFLVPPVLMLIIQQSMVLGAGVAAGGLRERWRGRLSPEGAGPFVRPALVVAGRGLVYFCLYMLAGVYMCAGVTRWFGLPQLAHYGTLVAFLVPYVLACVFFALACSGFVYRREDCILLFVSFSAPLLFLSGVSWPGDSMPGFWRAVSWAFPSTFGINGYVRVSGMGARLADVLPEACALWAQAGAYFLAACLLYRRRARGA